MRLWLYAGYVCGVRLTDDLLNRIKLMLAVQSLCKKYSASSIPQIKSISLAVPPQPRGVSRSSRT